jgi:four helix bundle protein
MSLSHHSLVAWQRADDLFIKLHRLSSNAFPASERYELSSQLRRVAYSVAANIVEGFARRHRRDRLHFLNIAESSLAEVGYCIHVARRLGYISEALECITSPRVTHQTYLTHQTHQTHRLARSRVSESPQTARPTHPASRPTIPRDRTTPSDRSRERA